MERKGTISKDRVKKNGEVFTPDEIVNDMLDMLDNNLAKKVGVKEGDDIDDTLYIKDTRLEPTCGDGAILVRILDRKLGRVKKIKERGGNWEEALLYAVASIYGMDITADNVVMSKRRMLDVIENGSTGVLSLADETPVPWQSDGFDLRKELKEVIELILDYNIQCGNTLTGERYKIYKPSFDCWTVDIESINEDNIYRHKVDEKGKELAGWETIKTQLMLTQWKFEGIKYINRQVSFDSYMTYRSTGQEYMTYKTEKLDLYRERIEQEEYSEEYDF